MVKYTRLIISQLTFKRDVLIYLLIKFLMSRNAGLVYE